MADRKYSPVWNILKVNGVVKITAPKPFHRRIIRAVIKEKYMDMGYHLLMSEAKRKQTLAYNIKQTVITFTLIENRMLSRL